MLRLVAIPSKYKPRRQKKYAVERLVTTSLPPMPSGLMATIDQTAYEFYKQSLAIFGLRLCGRKPMV